MKWNRGRINTDTLMLKFYRNDSDRFTNWVDEKLEEMVVAHKLIDVNGDESLPNGVSLKDLPALSDGKENWTTESEIREFLEELHKDLKFSRSLKSDACYIDPENPDQCL